MLQLNQKIWSNQFVDLSILLSQQTSQSFQIQLQETQLTMTPKKKILMLNTEQWNQAFTIYMPIYVEKYPDQAVHMLQYMGHIQVMAQMSGDFAARHYDQMFRNWQQSTPLPWNVINQSLHAKALAVRLRQKVIPSKRGTAQQQKPCFFFRSKGFATIHLIDTGIIASSVRQFIRTKSVHYGAGQRYHKISIKHHRFLNPTQKHLLKASDFLTAPLKRCIGRYPTVTQIRAGILDQYLQGYSPTKREFLVDSVINGFQIPFEGNIQFRDCRNRFSARKLPHILKEKKCFELKAKRVVTNFMSLLFKIL